MSYHTLIILYFMYIWRKNKEVHKEWRRKEMSGKSQNFIELLPSVQLFSINENVVSPSKNLLENRNWTFPVVRCFTWKREFISSIWWMILVSSQVVSIVSIWVKKFCNIHSFLFQPYQYQNTTNTQKRQHSFWRHLDCSFLIKKRKHTLEILTGNTWLKIWNFANYCENWFLQFNFPQVG